VTRIDRINSNVLAASAPPRRAHGEGPGASG
jgi:hypothetical protein